MGPILLGLRHAVHRRACTSLLAACVGVSVALPAGVRSTAARFAAAMTARADATPLVVGAKGSRFDLVMALVYLRRSEVALSSMADADAVAAGHPGVVIPVNLRFTARGRPIVATGPEYLELRRLSPAEGTGPMVAGDVLVGARLARAAGVRPGDHLFSDQREVFDLAKPAALRMRVVGVLPELGVPEDDAAIVSLETAWILEGLSHAHAAPSAAPDRLVLEKSAGSVTLSEEMVDANEVTGGNITTYHLHAERGQLPITGMIVAPATPKEGTLLASRLNAGRTLQAASPSAVASDLLAYVFRIRTLLEAVSLVVAGLTVVLLTLVTVLSIQVRGREIETYRRIGASRAAVAAVFAAELGAVLLVGAAFGAAVGAAAAAAGGQLVKLL